MRAWVRRIKRSKPGGPTTTQRDLRLFLTVFLVVFLGGLGVPGAQALWSQSATTQATVRTGTWVDYTRPGFSMPMTVTAKTEGRGGGWTLVAEWTPDPPDNPPRVTYRGSLDILGPGGGPGSSEAINGPQKSVSVGISAPQSGAHNDFKLTLTPIVDRVQGKTIEKRLTVLNNGRVTVSDWR